MAIEMFRKFIAFVFFRFRGVSGIEKITSENAAKAHAELLCFTAQGIFTPH
jgi:hypothetical protein